MKPAIEIMRERAAAAVRELVARVPAGSIRAVFAGGSVARDEVWSASRNGTLEIFSDIDLYVVVADDADASLVRRAAAEVASGLAATDAGIRFRRGADFGVYRLDDLLGQPIRPGTVDLADHHLWLFGDRAIAAMLAGAPSRPMEPEEALYLLENRAWDLLEADADEAAAITAKVMLDVLAAHLIAEGRFVATYTSRRAADEAQPARLASSDARAAVAAAEQFRRGERAEMISVDAWSLLTEAWCALGAKVVLGDERRSDAAAILAQRCRRGRRAENYREFVRWCGTLRMSKTRAALTGLRYTALSPRAALRTHAVARGLVEARRSRAEDVAFHSGYVARLSSRMAPHETTLDRRVRAAMKASV